MQIRTCIPEAKMVHTYAHIFAYVDDLIIATQRSIKRLNPAYYFGITIGMEADGHILNKNHKIFQLLETLGLQDAHSVAIPMQTDFLKNDQKNESLSENSKYRTDIRKLFFNLTTTIRPNIATAGGIPSRKASSPTQRDQIQV